MPMGGFRHTGVGDGTARNHYGTIGQLQDATPFVITSVVGTDTLTGNLTPAITGFATGMTFILIPVNTNTSAATIALNGLSAKAIQKFGSALVAGDLVAGKPALLSYDGTQFQLLNPGVPVLSGYALLASANTFLGNSVISNTNPALDLHETDGAVDNKRWRWTAAGEAFFGTVINDALSVSTNWLVVNRTGTTVDSIALAASSVLVNGVSVRDASILAAGTLADARFPSTLPAISGANLTGILQAQVAPLTGSFTGTLTGYASPPTGTVFYTIMGGICTLYITSAITGTSNSTSMTMTGLPAACQPAVATAGVMEATNGGVANSLARFLTGAGSGTITFTANVSGDLAAGFGGSGTKGLPTGWSIRYKL